MFADRREAARLLAEKLVHYRGRKDAVVLAIPRGGVVIGAVVAEELGLPLDVILTKKIGHPFSREYAIGVVNLTSEIIDEAVVERDEIPWSYVENEASRIRKLLRERYRLYRGGKKPLSLEGTTAIIVDDGMATGNTMKAAVRLAKRESARDIVAAVPVASPRSAAELGEEVDELVCLAEPYEFGAIGAFYERFDQVEDEEAIRLLRAQSSPRAARAPIQPPSI